MLQVTAGAGAECIICQRTHLHPTDRGRINLLRAGTAPPELLDIESEAHKISRSRLHPHPLPLTSRLRERLLAAGATLDELDELDSEYYEVLAEAQYLGTSRGTPLVEPRDSNAIKRAREDLIKSAKRVESWKLAHPEKNAEYVKRYRARRKRIAAGLPVEDK